MKNKQEKEQQNYQIKPKEIKDIVPINLISQVRQTHKIQNNTKSTIERNISSKKLEDESPFKINYSFPLWKIEDELPYELKGEVFEDPFKDKIVLPFSLTETTNLNKSCIMVKWIKPQEYIKYKYFEKELLEKEYSQANEELIKSKIRLILKFQRNKDKKQKESQSHIQMNTSNTSSNTNTGNLINKKSFMSKLNLGIKSKITKNTLEVEKTKNIDYLRQAEVEEAIIKYDNFYKIIQKKYILKISNSLFKQESDEDYERRIKKLEDIERDRQEQEAKKNKNIKKKVKIQSVPVDTTRKMIKVSDPSVLSTNNKLSAFSRWLTSIYQCILDMKIVDCYTRKDIIKKIYPQYENEPIVNPDGRYWVQLYFQGRVVKVEIDDLMPVTENYDLLFPRCENYEELWPALLTKALIKLYSYKFINENYYNESIGDGAIVYSLTGYIGERILVDPKGRILYGNQNFIHHKAKENSIESEYTQSIKDNTNTLSNIYSYSLIDLLKNLTKDSIFSQKHKHLLFYRNSLLDKPEEKEIIKKNGFLNNLIKKVEEEEMVEGPETSPRQKFTTNEQFESTTGKITENTPDNKKSSLRNKYKQSTTKDIFSLEKKAHILGLNLTEPSSLNIINVNEDQRTRFNYLRKISAEKEKEMEIIHETPEEAERKATLIVYKPLNTTNGTIGIQTGRNSEQQENQQLLFPQKKILTSLKNLMYKKIFKGLLENKKESSNKLNNQQDNNKNASLNPTIGSYYLNFCYGIVDFFDTGNFNMNRLDPLDFKDLLNELKTAKSSKNYKTLTLEEKKKFMEDIENLKLELKKRKKDKLADLNQPSKRSFYLKLKNDALGVTYPKLYFIDEAKIEMAKKCLLNNWKFPPLTYISDIVEAENKKKEFYKSKRASINNEEAASIMKTKERRKNKLKNMKDKEIKSKQGSSVLVQEVTNKKEAKEEDQIPVWMKYYYDFVGKDLSMYNNEVNHLERAKGCWVSEDNFFNIFNEVLILHDPYKYNSNIKLSIKGNKFNDVEDETKLYFSLSPGEKNNYNNKFYSENSCVLITFEPNINLSNINDSLNYIVIDIKDTSNNYIYKDFVLKRYYSVYQFDELKSNTQYIIIIKGGVYPKGFTMSIISDHIISQITECEYFISIMNYNTQEIKFKSQSIISNENCIISRFKIALNSNMESIVKNMSKNVGLVTPSLIVSSENKLGYHQYMNSEIIEDGYFNNNENTLESIEKKIRFINNDKSPNLNIYFYLKYKNQSSKLKNFSNMFQYFLNDDILTQLKIPFLGLTSSKTIKDSNLLINFFTLSSFFKEQVEQEEISIVFCWDRKLGISENDIKFSQVEYIEPYEINDLCIKNNKQGILFKEFLYLKDIISSSMEIQLLCNRIEKYQVNTESNDYLYLPTIPSYLNDMNNSLVNTQNAPSKQIDKIDKDTIVVEEINDSLQFKLKLEKDNCIIFEKIYYKSIYLPCVLLQGLQEILEKPNKKLNHRESIKDNNSPYLLTLSSNYKELMNYCYYNGVVDIKFIIKLYPSNTICFIQDNTKEIEEQKLIEGWENSNPGRTLYANTSRVKYLIKLKKEKNIDLTQEETNILTQPKEDLIMIGNMNKTQTNNKSKKNEVTSPKKGKPAITISNISNVHNQLSIVPGLLDTIKDFNFNKKIKDEKSYLNKTFKNFYKYGTSNRVNKSTLIIDENFEMQGSNDMIKERLNIFKKDKLLEHLKHNHYLLSEKSTNSESFNQAYTGDFSNTGFNFKNFTLFNKEDLTSSMRFFTKTRGFFYETKIKSDFERRDVLKKKSNERYDAEIILKNIYDFLHPIYSDKQKYQEIINNQKEKEKLSAELIQSIININKIKVRADLRIKKEKFDLLINMIIKIKEDIYIKELKKLTGSQLKYYFIKIKEEIETLNLELSDEFKTVIKDLKIQLEEKHK